MKRLLAVLLAAAIALPVAADTQVVCTITAQAQTACSAITVSEAARLDPCRCNANGGGGGAEPSVYDDAIALWKLDEASGTRADSIGSLDLTDNNTVGYANMGPSGTVAAFAEGTNEYLSIASGWTHGTSYMYTGWVKNPSPANFDSVITTNLANFNANVMIALYVSSGVLRAVQADETGANPVTIDSLVSLSDGGWHFFAVWFDDADKKLRLSVDLETAVASAAMTGNYKTYPGTSNLYIGSATGTTDAWDGNIARVGYYSTAGSDAIRTSLYNSGKGKAYADLTTAEKVGLVSFWNLDEASGIRADSHGSNTLTDNNTVGSTTNSYPANLPGRVASFVAANSEYLSAPDDGAGLSIDGDHSFSVWFYSTGTGTNRAIISQRTAGDGAYQLYLDTSDQLHAYVTDSASGFSEPVRAGAIADNGWHLAIMTYTASDKKLRLYLDDGSETAGSALSNGPVSSTQDFNVVRLASVIYGSIRLSSLGAWSRVLTPEERAALYNSGDGAVLP